MWSRTPPPSSPDPSLQWSIVDALNSRGTLLLGLSPDQHLARVVVSPLVQLIASKPRQHGHSLTPAPWQIADFVDNDHPVVIDHLHPVAVDEVGPDSVIELVAVSCPEHLGWLVRIFERMIRVPAILTRFSGTGSPLADVRWRQADEALQELQDAYLGELGSVLVREPALRPDRICRMRTELDRSAQASRHPMVGPD